MMMIPPIGSVALVSTDWSDVNCGLSAVNVYRTASDILFRVASEDYDPPNTLRFYVDNPLHEDVVIPLERITHVEMLDTSEMEESEVTETDQVWEVEGSKGNVYTVTKKNGHLTCTCRGFDFRQSCKHLRVADEKTS